MSALSNDYDKLRVKQTELFVAQQIYKELQMRNTQDLYINQLSLNNIDDEGFTFRDFNYQQAGLELLVTKKLIQILNSDKLLKIGIHVHIENIKSFKAFYVNLFESIPSVGNCARIIYSTKTGKGKVNGASFKLNRKSRNRKVFEYLVKRPNQYLTKNKLWVVAGEKGKFIDDTDGVIEFNYIITALRDALGGISPEHLRLKKTVILDAEVTLTD